MRRLLASLACLALLPSCAEVGKLAARAVEPPRLSLRSVDLRSADLEGATLGFHFDLENRNGFGLEVARVEYTLDVEGKRVLAGDAPGGLDLPARGTAPLTLTARVRFGDVPGVVELLGKQDAVRYRLAGTVGVRTPVGVLDLPISHEARLPLPRLPGFELAGLDVRSVSLSRLTLEVRLRVSNPNAFPVPAGSIDAVVALGGGEVARVEGRALAEVPAGGSAVVAMPVEVDLAGAGRAAAALVRGGTVEVGVTGAAEVAGLHLPIDVRTRLQAR
jgi:LEA14-like dessication related protein